jgi:hypothetical protein
LLLKALLLLSVIKVFALVAITLVLMYRAQRMKNIEGCLQDLGSMTAALTDLGVTNRERIEALEKTQPIH